MDIAVEKIGKDVGKVVGLKEPLGINVIGDLRELIDIHPDVAVLSTTSHFPWLADQALPLLDNGIHVVTTCEEAVYPFFKYPVVAREIDQVATTTQVAFLGIGVNPGYMMDYRPATIAAMVPRVDRVHVIRRVNLSERRARLQQKLGAGLTRGEAEARLKEKKLGHVGLDVSAHVLAHALGWTLETSEEQVEILLAKRPLPWYQGTLEPGKVKGLRQVLIASADGEERIRLTLEMSLGLEDAGDTVEIEGPMSFSVHTDPISGDWATASIVVNAIYRMPAARPGLRTVLDMPPVVGRGA